MQHLKCGCKLLRTIFPILTSMIWLARCGVHHKSFKHLNFYKLGMWIFSTKNITWILCPKNEPNAQPNVCNQDVYLFSLGLFHISNFKDFKKIKNRNDEKSGWKIYLDTRLKALECGRLGVTPHASVGAWRLELINGGQHSN